MSDNKITSKDIISDYNQIYSGPGIRTSSQYYRWLYTLLRPKSMTALLDVSCGEGMFLREVSKADPSIKTSGLDISDKAVSIAGLKSSGADLLVADGQYIPFKSKTFDYVTCLGSLEHYLDTALGLREIHRVAKDNAGFCIVLPNSLSIDLFLHVIKEGDKPVEDFQIIEKTATRVEWQKMLAQNGFEIVKVYGSNLWPEFFQEGTWKVKSIAKFFRRLLIKIFCPVNLAREFVFICRKKA